MKTIRNTALQSVLFLLVTGLIGSIVSDDASCQDTQTPGTSSEQGAPAETASLSGPTEERELTDADRIIRLETSIAADKKQQSELDLDLKKAQSEEETASADVMLLGTQIENANKLLQEAKDSENATEVAKQQALLSELEPKHRLATEQFNLAVETRKTVQEQIATLQQKIAQDQESLDILQGVSVAEETEATTPIAAETPAKSDSASDSTSEQTAAADDATPAEPEEEVVSEDLAKAREEVEDKAKSLQEIERALDSLDVSKALLEKNVELESARLETSRQKYDVSESALQVAEKEFNEKLASGIPAGEQQQLRTQISDLQQRLRDQRNEIRTSTDRIQEFRKQLLTLQTEETQLIKQRESLQREMAAAKRSEWVVKLRDYLYVTVPKIVVILVLTIFLWMFVKVLCGRSRSWIAHTGLGTEAERQNRADTLAGVFQNTGNVAIAVGSVLMILDASGVPIAALLGGAGVVGLAVAFGAQSLIKDYFCGFILLLENQYKVNDVVTIGGVSGVVERITLRITVLRDFEGKVHFIPNGQISIVTNATMDWSRAVLEIGVAYKENVDEVIEELKQLTHDLREDADYSDAIVGDIEMLGVDNLGDSSVVIKFGLKTQPSKQWSVKRELLRRIKNAFDQRGIEIPFPHQTVIYRTENSGPASPVDVQACTKAEHEPIASAGKGVQ